MNNKNFSYSNCFKGYLQDLAKGSSAPGGGSSAALVLALAISLLEMASKISFKKNNSNYLKNQLGNLAELRLKAASWIDQDSILFYQFIKSPPDQRKKKYKQLEDLLFSMAESCINLINQAEKINQHIITSIKSDFYLALVYLAAVLTSIIYNLQANGEYLGIDYSEKISQFTIIRDNLWQWAIKQKQEGNNG